ncbi:MAG: hypothetical protein PHF00_00010 [Elusimicrobia bacterium]|nr:hypothetical protein [Elusimicrobiota bacterium]
MQILVAMGLGSTACGTLHNSQAMNCCSLACLLAGAVLIGAALWHLRKVPGFQRFTNSE